jgi:hypothetical protein
MLISEGYRALNKELHERRPDYGASGAKWAGRVAEAAKWINAASILDYGCGKQSLGMALSHLIVLNYDPAIEGLDKPPEPADLVVCGDVLEHVEPEYLDAVLDDIARCTLKGAFLVISTQAAVKTLADGRNAHLIQKHEDWWLPKLMKRWELKMFQATDGEFVVFAAKKRAVRP